MEIVTQPAVATETVAFTETPEQKIARLEAENADLRQKLATAEAKAAKDRLTELPTREVVEIALAAELARLRREGGQFALALFDLDHFKQVNDTDGHLQGNQVLRVFANKMREQLRETDIIGRWGGEEFMALLPVSSDSTKDEIEHALDRFHTAVRSINRRKEGVAPEPLTVSVGCVIINQESAFSPDEAILIADKNLYVSKETGRNRSTITIGREENPIPATPQVGSTSVPIF